MFEIGQKVRINTQVPNRFWREPYYHSLGIVKEIESFYSLRRRRRYWVVFKDHGPHGMLEVFDESQIISAEKKKNPTFKECFKILGEIN